jgi:hypothetical protein
MKIVHLISLTIWMSAAACNWTSGPIKYREVWPYVSTFAHARFSAGIVSRGEFSDRRLLATFQDFLAARPTDKICQMILAHDPKDLAANGRDFGPFTSIPISSDGRSLQHDGAEFFFFDGAAIGIIKRNGSVQTVQILGDRDPRIVPVGRQNIRITWFEIRRLTHVQSPDDWIALHATSAQPPSEEDAYGAYAYLAAILGAKTCLFLGADETDRDYIFCSGTERAGSSVQTLCEHRVKGVRSILKNPARP